MTTMTLPPTLRFTAQESEDAHAAWKFNCGPAALCAILGMTPDEIRPHLLDFERRGHVGPKQMFDILAGLKVSHRQVYRGDDPAGVCRMTRGLLRVQFGGRWCEPGVPFAARYRRTHWAALDGPWAYDVNAGGWLTRRQWANELLPHLMREAVKDGDGRWWPTHGIEVEAKGGAA